MNTETEELNESELGKIEYWEKCYEDELKQFDRYGDPGEIWFGNDIVKRLTNWIKTRSDLIRKDSNIADIGCGNGMLLVELGHVGFSKLTGLDYSTNAISLCQKVAKKYELNISFMKCDILDGLTCKYDILLDKGTYDAISLNTKAKDSRSKYIKNVHSSLSSDGVFIIVSCNWTENELIEQFKLQFSLLELIPTPQFSFGGKVGNVVTICVFKKKIDE